MKTTTNKQNKQIAKLHKANIRRSKLDICNYAWASKGELVSTNLDAFLVTPMLQDCSAEFIHRDNLEQLFPDQHNFTDADKIALPEFEGLSYKIAASEFLSAIKRVSHAMSDDETRHVLCGFLLEKGKVVATDGKRLTTVNIELFPMGEQAKQAEFPKNIIIPGSAEKFLEKALAGVDDTLLITIGDSYAGFKTSSFEYITRFTQGNYPNYKAAIPDNGDYSFKIDKRDFKSLCAIVKKHYEFLKLAQGAELENSHKGLSSVLDSKADLEKGTNTLYIRSIFKESVIEDVLPTSYCSIIRPIGFNPRYLLECFESLDYSLEVRVNDDTSPIKVISCDSLEVIMPRIPKQSV